jgi:hypothetical protein
MEEKRDFLGSIRTDNFSLEIRGSAANAVRLIGLMSDAMTRAIWS